MSLSAFSIAASAMGEARIKAAVIKKPPTTRTLVALRDQAVQPEAR